MCGLNACELYDSVPDCVPDSIRTADAYQCDNRFIKGSGHAIYRQIGGWKHWVPRCDACGRNACSEYQPVSDTYLNALPTGDHYGGDLCENRFIKCGGGDEIYWEQTNQKCHVMSSVPGRNPLAEYEVVSNSYVASLPDGPDVYPNNCGFVKTLVLRAGCGSNFGHCTHLAGRPDREVASPDEGRTAAVRCCSMDGNSCSSSLPSGGCRSGRTFAEAQGDCAANGMRLCTEVELESQVCCHTGCQFNCAMIWAQN